MRRVLLPLLRWCMVDLVNVPEQGNRVIRETRTYPIAVNDNRIDLSKFNVSSTGNVWLKL